MPNVPGEIPPTAMASRKTGAATTLLKAAIAIAMVVAALVYIGSSLSDAPFDIRSAISRVTWRELGIATLALVPMYVAQAGYHVLALEALSPQNHAHPARLPAMAIYLQAQIVRYLPGKIWGVVYQAHAMSGSHPPSRVLGANLVQTGATLLMATGICASVILAHRLGAIWLLGLPATIAAMDLLHRSPLPSRLMDAAKRVPRLGRVLDRVEWSPLGRRGMFTALLSIEWAFFALGLTILFGALLPVEEALVAMAWYAGASILSLAAIVVPAGLAVREALFIGGENLMASAAGELAVLAVAARIVFLGAEIGGAALLTSIQWMLRRD
jgi:hypothetical protein